MRREHQRIDEVAGAPSYTFHFQITNKGGRQACSVKVQAPNIHDATKVFRENWPMIESMARNGLANSSADDGMIKLAVPGCDSKLLCEGRRGEHRQRKQNRKLEFGRKLNW